MQGKSICFRQLSGGVNESIFNTEIYDIGIYTDNHIIFSGLSPYLDSFRFFECSGNEGIRQEKY